MDNLCYLHANRENIENNFLENTLHFIMLGYNHLKSIRVTSSTIEYNMLLSREIILTIAEHNFTSFFVVHDLECVRTYGYRKMVFIVFRKM